MKHHRIGAAVALVLPLAAAAPSWAGEIVDYSHPPKQYGAVATETHRIKDGVTRIDRHEEAGDPKAPMLRQEHTRPGQPFRFVTWRSADGRLVGVHAMDDPFAAPPPVELRRETGRIETHLGRQCRTWEAARPSGLQRTFLQSGCSTAEGIDLWRKQANIDTITADRLQRAKVTAEEVRPPLEALGTASLMREAAGSDHRGDYEVVLEGEDGSSASYRRSGNWRYVEEQGRGFISIRINNGLTGVAIDYSRGKDGARRLGWSRPPLAPISRRTQFGGRSLPGEPSQTILGERCVMRDMMPGVMDAGQIDCLTKDGVPLISNRTSWGSGRSLRAVRLSRKPQSLAKVSLARAVTDVGAWRTIWTPSAGQD